jgi:glucose-1-phosphate thymidylyltransferase
MGLKVIIPAAGKGTRLRPHTFTTPKVLLHVAGKPVLGHLLDSLLQCAQENKDFNIEEIIIVYGYLGDRVIEYVEKEFGNRSAEYGVKKISYVNQEEEIGLAHAVYVCRSVLEGQDEPVLVLLGDTIFDVDYAKLIKSTGKDAYGSLGVLTLDDPRRFGVVETQNGYVTKVVEKPKEKKRMMALLGLYYFEHSKPLFDILDELVEKHEATKPPLVKGVPKAEGSEAPVTSHQSQNQEWWQSEIQLTEGLQILANRGNKIQPYEIDGWFDCGTPEAFLATNRHLLKNQLPITSYQFPGSEIIPPVVIHSEATIENSKVGPYVSVGRGVTLKDAALSEVILNEGAKVIGAELKERIVGENEEIISSSRQ